jgi:hypothetical protein
MARSPSPAYRLADYLMKGQLRDFVLEHRAAGQSWRWISHALWAATDGELDVTYEALRRWFSQDEDGGEGEAA